MKLINYLFCLIMICALQWSTVAAASSEIKLPSKVNIEDGEGTNIIATFGFITNKKNNALGYTEDVPLKNCKYNFNNKTVICNATVNKINYTFTFNVKANQTCEINSKTVFKSCDLYSYDKEDKQYVKDEYLVFIEIVNNKIDTFKCTANKFELSINKKCKVTLQITKSRISSSKK